MYPDYVSMGQFKVGYWSGFYLRIQMISQYFESFFPLCRSARDHRDMAEFPAGSGRFAVVMQVAAFGFEWRPVAGNLADEV